MVRSIARLSGQGAAFVATGCMAFAASAGEQPQFTAEGQLLKPEDYREWVNVASGLNMAYGPAQAAARGMSMFTNVFVAPAAYRGFLKTGVWPEQTLFILEIRAASSVNKTEGGNGYFQGDLLGIEAEVKDSRRFPGGWAFFNMGRDNKSGAQIPASADCYSCHASNAAVENTFVQFYPVLRDVAKEKGTLKKVPETF